MKKVTLNGMTFELYYSTKTMLDIEKRCGDTANLKEWLSNGTSGETFSRLAGVLTDMINGAVYKHNADIALGLCDGEKKPFMDVETILAVMSPAEAISYKEDIFGAMSEGLTFEIPDGMPEPDPDLADVESEKNV